ncbi:unnamed protein product [Schistosoma mattheei]|uniref:Uncharacterized protein n=1 Tax=Schistosoma mattheei TaxID=31246 RepID=A0A183PIM9_9TREM|nr:unnamed protein product [Schistosoma mattheei]
MLFGVSVILRKLMLPDEFDPVSPSFTVKDVTTGSEPLAGHYQQQPTMGENKPDSDGRKNQEESREVDRTHVKESTQLNHQTSPHVESTAK